MEEYKHFYQKRVGEEFRESLVPSAGQTQTEHQSSFKANSKLEDLGIAMFHQRGQSFATEDDSRYSDSKNHDIGHCTVLDKKVNDFVPQEASANNLLQRPPSFLLNTKENMPSKERNSVVSFSPRQINTAVKPVTDNATNQRQSSLSLEERPTSFNKDGRFSQSFGVGTFVEAQLEDKAKYQPGKIVRSHVDGSYDILFDDGESKLGVPRERIRLRWEGEYNDGLAGKKQNQNTTEVQSNKVCESRADDSFKIGSMVEVRKKSDGKFISGKIMRKRLDGTFDVLCSDGDQEYGEFGVPIEFIRSKTSRSQPAVIQSNPKSQKNDAGPKNSFTDKSKRTVTEMKLDVGTSIEARYRGKGKYYPGKITRKRFDGTYDVLYSDGGREIGVPEEFIRFKVDERFEENGPKLHKSYDEYLTYDDDTGWGQNEVGLRSTKFESHSDDVIEGKQKGKDKYHVDRGITRQRTYGSYDILCDDRELNNGVRRDIVRSNDEQVIESGPSKPDNLNNVEGADDIEVGTRIEAKLRGKDEYLPAKIARKRFDGSFDIVYNDGSKEIGVSRDSIKNKMQISSKTDQEETSARNHEKGEKVRSKDRGQILVGTIKSVKEDNSLDIQYDDGYIERLEKKDLIQNNDEKKREIMFPVIQADESDDVPKEPSSKKLAKSQTYYKESERASDRVLCVGDKVECRFRGAVNSRYYPGNIVSIHPDGTYDVDYNDGDKDRHLSAEHIRLLVDKSHVDRVTNSAATKEGNTIIVMDGSTSNKIKEEDNPADRVEDILEDESGRFIVGDKVECRFRGAVNSRYYPGHIVRKHPDGTYDVDYDDGDTDRHLGAEHIRLLVSRSSHDAIKMMDGGSSKELNKVENIAQGMIQGSQADGVVDNSSTGYPSRNDWTRSQTHNKGNERASDRELCVGDKVECRFRGAVNSRYYPGHIVSKHPDGTYDVDYDDGDKDRHLGAEHIRLLVTSRKYDEQSQMNNTSQSGYFNVGDRVEAKVGRLGFIPGVISRVTSPYMYDISFHNGNHEFGVSINDIRKLSSRKINDGEKNAVGQADGRENGKDGTIYRGELINKLETKLIVIEQEISAVRRILSEMIG